MEQANFAMQTNEFNWGQYLKDGDSWPVDVPEHLKLGAAVMAPLQISGGKQDMRVAKVIGRYSNDEGPFHVQFVNGMHNYCLRKDIRRRGEVHNTMQDSHTMEDSCSKMGVQHWEVPAAEDTAAVGKQHEKNAAKKKGVAKAPKKTAKVADDEESEEVVCTVDNWPTQYRLSHGQRVVATNQDGHHERKKIGERTRGQNETTETTERTRGGDGNNGKIERAKRNNEAERDQRKIERAE